MRNAFSFPSISEDFTHFEHNGGILIEANEKLISLQESLLSKNFTFTGERRQNFVNLETIPISDSEQLFQTILEEICSEVSNKVKFVTGSDIDIDQSLSAVWVENSSSHQNLVLHRDADSPGIVRATFSITPTRVLDFGVPVELDENLWDKFHFPIGKTQLPHFKDSIVCGELGGTALMTGTTYHRAPTTDEINSDFKKIFGSLDCFSSKKIPRIFGSIWARQ